MSLQDVRVKLEAGLNDIYTALEEKSATIPEQKNLTNVAPAIRSITGGGSNKPNIIMLKYIESTGTQYINTGCYVDSGFEWEMDFQFTDLSTSQWSGTGETLSASTAINSYEYFRVGANIGNNSNGWQSTFTSIPSDTERHTLHFKSGSQIIDGVQVADYIFNSTTKGTLPFLIGAFHSKWENTVKIASHCKMKIYSSKIKNNGTLVRDYVPAMLNGKACLYDKVTKYYFPNQGTGDFVAGEEIQGEETVNQVVNYTMLYDGSLGSAGENGANVCSEVTGGYAVNPKDVDDYEKSDVIFSDNYIELNAVRNNINKMSSFGTKNLLNLSNYKKVANIISGYSSSSTSVFNSFYFSSERGYVSSANRISPLFSNYINTNKTLYSLDIDIEENYYFSGFHSMVSKGNSYLRLHNAFLVKQDNFQPILDLAGITTAYTDEASICADSTVMTTILNNEEAVNYMLLNCTGTFMLAFIQSSTALTALASSPYVKNVHLNAHWLKFLNFLR